MRCPAEADRLRLSQPALSALACLVYLGPCAGCPVTQPPRRFGGSGRAAHDYKSRRGRLGVKEAGGLETLAPICARGLSPSRRCAGQGPCAGVRDGHTDLQPWAAPRSEP